MNDIIDYRMLENAHCDGIEAQVKDHVMDGWELYGYPFADNGFIFQCVIKRKIKEEMDRASLIEKIDMDNSLNIIHPHPMNLIDAVRSGRRFKRKDCHQYYSLVDIGSEGISFEYYEEHGELTAICLQHISKEDLLANDYYLEGG